MSNGAQSWSVVVIAYNEAGSLGAVVEAVSRFLESLESEMKECIVVNDGSDDKTLDILTSLSERHSWLHVVSHSKNMGIHAALKTGYKRAQFENVVAIPGDGQFDIGELYAFRSFPTGRVISFYRTEKEGYDFFRQLLTFSNRAFNRIFLGLFLRDVNWVKIYKKEALDKLGMRSQSVLLETEICFQLSLKGERFIEVPCKYLNRSHGVSKGAGLKTVKNVLFNFMPFYFISCLKLIKSRIQNIFYKLLLAKD